MRAALAERLLAEVMQWAPEDVARERPVLEALADLKYNAYQQYSPGMRFVESLALWLEQFSSIGERQVALDFVKQHLIFLGASEMDHFAAIAYPDYIRPLLLDHAAKELGLPRYRVRAILESGAFERLEKSTLFLGLSDGARIDFFRRSNRQLSHEQIFQSYDLPKRKLEDIKGRLLGLGGDPPCRAIVLIDDFSASGTSYFREEAGQYTGKVAKFLNQAAEHEVWRALVRFPDTKVIATVFAGTDAAVTHIRSGAKGILGENSECFHVSVVQRLHPEICLDQDSDEPFVELVEAYYDSRLEDEHTRKGGTDLKYGFARGGLPLVLHHNSPNNALFLLWAEEHCDIRALFPRVSRHRSEG